MQISASDVLELVRSGFTADQITTLMNMGAPAEPEEPAPEPAPEPEKPADPAPAPEPPKGPTQDELITAVLQKLAGAGSAIDIPPSFDINKRLEDHFVSLIGGDNKGGI